MITLFQSAKDVALIELRETALRIIGLLLEGIRIHAAGSSESLREAFQVTIREQARGFADAQQDSRAMLLNAGSILQTMQRYQQDSDNAAHARRREMQTMVCMLTKALARTLDDGHQSANSLLSFEQRIESATKVDDMRQLKGQLEDCLKFVQAEAKRQSGELVQLREMVQSFATSPIVTASYKEREEDPVTGLPSSTAVRRLLAEAFQHQRDVYVVLFRLDSLQLINVRYGRAAGDAFLLEASQLLAQGLKPGDGLYRWNGPVLVATLEGRTALPAVRAEVERLAARTREHSLTIGGRAVYFRVGVSLACIRVLELPDETAVVSQIESFVNKEADSHRRAGN